MRGPSNILIVEGLDEAAADLRLLHSDLTRRMMREAMVKTLAPITDLVRFLAPSETGTLRESIGQRVRTYQRGNVTVGLVGPRYGFRRPRYVRMGRPTKTVTTERKVVSFDMARPGLAPDIVRAVERVTHTKVDWKSVRIIRTFRRRDFELSPTFYAHYVEFGTRLLEAQPFMRPAWDTISYRVEKMYADALYAQLVAKKRKKWKVRR